MCVRVNQPRGSGTGVEVAAERGQQRKRPSLPRSLVSVLRVAVVSRRAISRCARCAVCRTSPRVCTGGGMPVLVSHVECLHLPYKPLSNQQPYSSR
ncbi:hypothetical protein E2C01_060477 [Portunus trituberculatus]|uniref:Uncharacterized protein n=1 Tax=Portunus trituberculatus TaxID=210409 RepID=A0A5B7H2L7_PORTR|nr:hypothetical protein [Portunus trituberculatus]